MCCYNLYREKNLYYYLNITRQHIYIIANLTTRVYTQRYNMQFIKFMRMEFGFFIKLVH